MKILLALFLALALTGCASADYKQYAQAQQAIATAKGAADAARYRAMADIAASGDSAAKVAAVMAMAMALGQGGASPAQQIAAPAPNAALQWASILVPSITQMYGIRANADVAMRSSDNAASTSIATTAGFVSLAGQIQAPAANVSTVTTSTDRNDTTSNVGANSGANSGNSGRLAGGYITDATSTPTVVTAPDPLIVTQPAPLVVNQPRPVVVNAPAPVIIRPEVVQPAPPIVLTQPPPIIVRPEIVQPVIAPTTTPGL